MMVAMGGQSRWCLTLEFWVFAGDPPCDAGLEAKTLIGNAHPTCEMICGHEGGMCCDAAKDPKGACYGASGAALACSSGKCAKCGQEGLPPCDGASPLVLFFGVKAALSIQ